MENRNPSPKQQTRPSPRAYKPNPATLRCGTIYQMQQLLRLLNAGKPLTIAEIQAAWAGYTSRRLVQQNLRRIRDCWGIPVLRGRDEKGNVRYTLGMVVADAAAVQGCAAVRHALASQG